MMIYELVHDIPVNDTRFWLLETINGKKNEFDRIQVALICMFKLTVRPSLPTQLSIVRYIIDRDSFWFKYLCFSVVVVCCPGWLTDIFCTVHLSTNFDIKHTMVIKLTTSVWYYRIHTWLKAAFSLGWNKVSASKNSNLRPHFPYSMRYSPNYYFITVSNKR